MQAWLRRFSLFRNNRFQIGIYLEMSWMLKNGVGILHHLSAVIFASPTSPKSLGVNPAKT